MTIQQFIDWLAPVCLMLMAANFAFWLMEKHRARAQRRNTAQQHADALPPDHPDARASWLPDKLTQEQRIKQARKNRAHLRKHVDETTLRILEEHFETHLPAFQRTTAGYDAMDAMRRDATREVILYIRQQIQLAEREAEL